MNTEYVPITKDEHLELLTYLCEIEDRLKQAEKALALFDDSNNWNCFYKDSNGRIDKFNYLNMDPRIMAYNGLKPLREAIGLNTWGILNQLRSRYNCHTVDKIVYKKREF